MTEFLPLPELLAPAGNLASFTAAMEEGASAVYLGAPGLNARALARDFSWPELAAMTQYAHEQGRKVYLAMNSLVREDELGHAVEALARVSELGVDALIIQDWGLYHLCRQYFPALPIHASTLMTVTNAGAASHLARLGFERVVLARELSLEEIQQICALAPVEIEVFIHGAMCFSYSGLCLFSSLYGGRSSLRGHCVQPCRRQYGLGRGNRPGRSTKGGSRNKGGRLGKSGKVVKPGKSDRGGYFFSMNDLCGLDFLASLRASRVRCLKIEGRLKSAAYVRYTVRAYRMMLDALDLPKNEQALIRQEANALLDEAMGRRRATGFFLPQASHQAISPHQSGNTGAYLGKVEQFFLAQKGRQGIQLTPTLPLAHGDRLRLHEEGSGERYSFTVKQVMMEGKRVFLSLPPSLLADLSERKKNHRLQGTLFRVDTATGQAKPSPQLSTLVQRAKGQELSKGSQAKVQAVQEALNLTTRAGTAGHGGKKGERMSFWLKVPSVSAVGQRIAVPISQYLVPLHRGTMQQVQVQGQRQVTGLQKKSNQEQTRAGRKNSRFPLIWALPMVILEAERRWYKQSIGELIALGYTQFQLAQLSQYDLFTGYDLSSLTLHGDYTINMLNSTALQEALNHTVTSVQFSLETDAENLQQALHTFFTRRRGEKGQFVQLGMTVYTRPALFSSRMALEQLDQRQALQSPHGEEVVLRQDGDLTQVYAAEPFSLLAFIPQLAGAGIRYGVIDSCGGPLKRELALINGLLRENQGFSSQANKRGKKHAKQAKRQGQAQQTTVNTGNYTGRLR